jgi:hypothetical protein
MGAFSVTVTLAELKSHPVGQGESVCIDYMLKGAVLKQPLAAEKYYTNSPSITFVFTNSLMA